MTAYRVGLSHDLYADGAETSWGDIGLSLLDQAGVSWSFLPDDAPELRPESIDGLDAVLFAGPAITAASVSGPRPPALFARFGVGLDSVDLAACTERGCAVTITPDGARRAVATAALTLILAVRQRLLAKHRVVVSGDWSSRQSLMGRGLTGATVGAIGLGNIATELFTLLEPFGTTNLAFDPRGRAPTAAGPVVRIVALEELLSSCDIVVVTAALTADTHHLLDGGRLAMMRSSAILVNVARGPIVETGALVAALTAGRLAGAGLDVFETEPLPAGHPLTTMECVVLSPHSLAWTSEMAWGNGTSAIRAILATRDGRRPEYLANPAALQHARYRTEVDR